MKLLNNDITFLEWDALPISEKREIWNHYWNPYEPQIGAFTKSEIVDNLTKSIPINALQCGIRSFGWGVYMLFVIVDNSKIRVPKQFSGLSVNKGVIKDWVNKDEAKVTFNYGGTLITNMNEKIVIG